MYVCNCNGIRERVVHEAIADGARVPAEIFQRQGCRAQCGRCVSDMQDMIDQQNKVFRLAAE